MKQIKSWAQYYVDLMTKLGLVRFSMFLATAIIVLAVSIQMGVTLFLRGTVDIVDRVRSVFVLLSGETIGVVLALWHFILSRPILPRHCLLAELS